MGSGVDGPLRSPLHDALASARAELDHDSPSARKASNARVLLLDGPREHGGDLARAARRQR
jgi:hypothetical protein